MPSQMPLDRALKDLLGIELTFSQYMPDPPNGPWLWTLNIYGPRTRDDKLEPWVQKFKDRWGKYLKGKQFFVEATLVKGLGEFLQAHYFVKG